ncbi:MAG: LysR family transcriptional regulator [Myxococcales bacterium]|nr:LysR family transcriptional regulator [Myxococcales bacterium]
MVNNQAAFDNVLPFIKVAESASFRGAAAALGVTAAAITRSVQRLEARLGVRLFERSTRSVRLTEEGKRYAARCREALAQMALAEAEISAARTPQGVVTVSASPALAGLIVPSVARFLQRHPAIRVELGLSDRIVRFAEEEVDVALRVGEVSDESLVAHALASPRWATVASPSYLARHGTPESLDDLCAHACLRFVPPRGRPRPWIFLDASGTGTRSFEPRGPLDVDNGSLLVPAAREELGIAQVFDFMVARDIERGHLIEVLPDLAAPGPPVRAVHPTSRRLLPRVQAFVSFLRSDLRP